MTDDTMNPVTKLSRDLAKSSMTLSDQAARYLVDSYYQMQENRIRSDNQVRSMVGTEEPHGVIQWLADQNSTLEKQIRRALDGYSKNHKVGTWLRNVDGIGPVIAAGLLAHIDIHKAPTAGHIWSFAGLINAPWSKGEKRPWNAELKVLSYKAGEAFVKVSNKDTAFYGHIYAQRKVQEKEFNDQGKFADQAKAILTSKKIGKDTDAYKAYSQGKLPPAHIHARARRYAVKLFLSHLHHVWYVMEFDKDPPNPYPIAHMGHAHMIYPPNFK